MSEAKRLILLTDDDDMLRRLVKRMLELDGYAVVEARSGAECIERFTASLPALVLLDAMMPGIDGFETCRRLKELPGGDAVPVLMITGLDDADLQQQVEVVGAVGVLRKPVDRALLRETLHNCLN
jgi:CheY-like chemotaxis protein